MGHRGFFPPGTMGTNCNPMLLPGRAKGQLNCVQNPGMPRDGVCRKKQAFLLLVSTSGRRQTTSLNSELSKSAACVRGRCSQETDLLSLSLLKGCQPRAVFEHGIVFETLKPNRMRIGVTITPWSFLSTRPEASRLELWNVRLGAHGKEVDRIR